MKEREIQTEVTYLKLSSLLSGIGVRPVQPDADIVNVTDEINNTREGSLFVCIKGEKTNGHYLAGEALKRGAAAVICEEPVEAAFAYRVENSRSAFSSLCSVFFGRPDLKLRLIGITGTNGKTTTACYIRFFLEKLGHKCAFIGTLGADTGEESRSTGYTTPKPDVFFEELAKAVSEGCEYCVCEVSSQALAQRRVDGAKFNLGVFTNIGTDHLDYHKTVSKLVEAKTRLCELSEIMLINADDAYSENFIQASGEKRVYLYSCRSVLSDYTAKNIRCAENGSDFILFSSPSLTKVHVPYPGMCSVYNVLAAAASCMALGEKADDIAPLVPMLPQVPGRLQLIEKNGVRVCVDFAHTPDALAAVIGALKISGRGRLITVFGCGGCRDKRKRPLMGETAARYSDEVIITSDNPRDEDPDDIIKDIKSGIKRKNRIFTEPDRARAISLALNKAFPGDTVLIAGKGNEDYQISGREKKHFSDLEEILKD